VSRRIIKRET